MDHRIDVAKFVLLLIALFVGTFRERADVHAADWPQWRGPHRDGVSAETGLLPSWPAGGPKVVWHATGLGAGYSSVVVGQGRLFTLGRHADVVMLTALDVATGQPLWTRKIGESSRDSNSTPTLDEDRLYALDPDGDLVCVHASNGELIWSKSFVNDFASRFMSARGCGESPLIDGVRLICTPGNSDAALVALNKYTGEVIWKARVPDLGPLGKDGAGFSSVVVTEAAGVRQYVQLMGRGLVGIAAEDGRFLWGYNAIANDFANIPTPIVYQDFVFAANGYTAGSVLLKLVPDGDATAPGQAVKVEVVYSLTGSQFQNHHGGLVRLGDCVFAGHGNNNGLPTCVELETGRIVWKRRGPGVGSAAIVSVNGQLIFRYQNGVVALIDASREGYRLVGQFEIPGAGGDSWSHPVVANGHLFLREQDGLWAHDLRIVSQESPVAKTDLSEMKSTAGISTLKRLGLSVERPMVTVSRAEGDAKSSTNQRYEYAMARQGQSPPESPLLITLTNESLLPSGTISNEPFTLLKGLSESLILNFEGTLLSDAGLQQLKRLNVVGINLELCGRVTDAGLSHLGELACLRMVVLAETGVTNVGLAHLLRNRDLVAIDLELCDGITDDACELLGQMKQLRSLGLKKSGFERHGISDAGLEKLQGLTELEVLNLYGNKVKDPGLAHLRLFGKLRELDLSLLDISDAGLESLKSMTSLQRLELLYSEGFAGPRLTNNVATSLEPLTNLTSLNLTGSKLDDSGLQQLHSLTKLRSLQLVRTQATADGIQSFRQAVPRCEVTILLNR